MRTKVSIDVLTKDYGTRQRLADAFLSRVITIGESGYVGDQFVFYVDAEMTRRDAIESIPSDAFEWVGDVSVCDAEDAQKPRVSDLSEFKSGYEIYNKHK